MTGPLLFRVINISLYEEVYIMKKMFENFDIWYDKDGLEDDRPILIAVRDREEDERWALASLTIEEAKKVYEYLKYIIES